MTKSVPLFLSYKLYVLELYSFSSVNPVQNEGTKTRNFLRIFLLHFDCVFVFCNGYCSEFIGIHINITTVVPINKPGAATSSNKMQKWAGEGRRLVSEMWAVSDKWEQLCNRNNNMQKCEPFYNPIFLLTFLFLLSRNPFSHNYLPILITIWFMSMIFSI